MTSFPPIATATVADAAHVYAGQAVNVLSRENWGEGDICKVEIADQPGVTTFALFAHLRDYAEVTLPYSRQEIGLVFTDSNGFRHRIYQLGRVGKGWGREAFTSGGYWKADGWWPSYDEASAELNALCQRLNGMAAAASANGAADADDGQPDEAQEWADFDPDC